MSPKITEILDIGNDVLLVRAEGDPVVVGKDDKGKDVKEKPTYEAFGWVSAISNNFADSAYLADPKAIEEDDQLANGGGPMLKTGAKPKKMTKAQIGEYALRLIQEQNAAAVAPKPKKITFT